MRVLVTRPLDDALEIQILLAARGHEVVVAPLLRVAFRRGTEIDLTGVQAILATSANGVRALAQRTGRRDMPVFAVGPQTAQAAQALGFNKVKSADGDAAALAQAVPSWASPKAGALLHAAGADAPGKLAEALTAAGFQVRSEILYDVATVGAMPANAADEIAAYRIAAVLLFSPRSARAFVQSLTTAGLTEHASQMIAACISQATAAALAPLALKEIRIAARPNQESLLNCLD
jgi:uroporphyrinogen-III synthase